MKTLVAKLLLALVLLGGGLKAADIALAWDPPNATPIEQIPLLKYNLYYGVNGGAVTNLLASTTNRIYTITNMVPGNYQITAKAINVWGKESVSSNVLTLPDGGTPGAPMSFKAIFYGTFNIELK